MSSVEDPVLRATEGLRAWSASILPGEAMQLLERMSKTDAGRRGEVLIANAGMVFGLDHLRAAVYHAERAIADGTNSSDSLAMETMLFASGERQLNSAIKKMSVTENTTDIVIAAIRGNIEPEQGWIELEEMASAVPSERLKRFGIEDVELGTCPRPEELVFERVAAVEVLKK